MVEEDGRRRGRRRDLYGASRERNKFCSRRGGRLSVFGGEGKKLLRPANEPEVPAREQGNQGASRCLRIFPGPRGNLFSTGLSLDYSLNLALWLSSHGNSRRYSATAPGAAKKGSPLELPALSGQPTSVPLRSPASTAPGSPRVPDRSKAGCTGKASCVGKAAVSRYLH